MSDQQEVAFPATGIKRYYTLSLQEIYTNLFQKHVASTGSLDMIYAGRHPRDFDDLPLWVPGWSTNQTIPGLCINGRYKGSNTFPGYSIAHFQKYSSSSTSSPGVSLSSNTMSVEAIRFGNIFSLDDVNVDM
ncbi:hypothetical protein K469DRAFT_689546 [Zopfia rhizophila CBS 207.26]|uniref:Uncharacterized protein n=1 Tax=Zopfia rhizophila CBS 207.26 TaxID=1314779 RepID=A0A6A6DVT3_9PEZI|nr:hypothetical protein K469DRAFT_689546 [Zopfia rhizophila CBS 207.26]